MQCLTIRADVTDEKEVIDAINATVEKFGRIDYAAYVVTALNSVMPDLTFTQQLRRDCGAT